MNLAVYIAKRYLFSKKSHNAINVISAISVCGVVIATTALVCALSVFNGFSSLVSHLFSNFDPELKITPRYGKVFDPGIPEITTVKEFPEVKLFSEVLQDNALVRYRERQGFATIKGVDKDYRHLATIDSILIDGEYLLKDDVANYAILGVGLASQLSVRANYTSPFEIYVPKRDEKVNLSNPATSFNMDYAFIKGVYATNQQVYDEGFMLIPISLARSLLHYDKEVSAIELALQPGSDLQQTKKKIRSILGDNFYVKDRYEQQDAAFKMMQGEKWMTYLILCFILSLALFNVIGSLSMLMIEKKEDVRTLRNMGASDTLISRIFLFEGWMISASGALLGILIGLTLCLIQQEFGIITLGNTAGTFVVDAYPVQVEWTDIITVLATVLAIGFVAAWYPVHYLGKKWIRKGGATMY